MKLHIVSPLMFGDFTVLELEPGTYKSRLHPLFNIVKTKKKNGNWLTFYFGMFPGIQFCYGYKCRCAMCKRNRIRALFFLGPLDSEGKEKNAGNRNHAR